MAARAFMDAAWATMATTADGQDASYDQAVKPDCNGTVARDGAGYVLDERQAGQDVAGLQRPAVAGPAQPDDTWC